MDAQAEIKAARTRLRMTQTKMAVFLGLPNMMCYRNKECGRTRFTDEEKAALTRLFHWDYGQMNDILYGGVLPRFYPNETRCE